MPRSSVEKISKMPTFRTLYDLRAYAERLIALGLGLAQPMLDRRGCDCKTGLLAIGDPGEGERVSDDGSQVYLTTRRMEG
jgi:hypothetical protein